MYMRSLISTKGESAVINNPNGISVVEPHSDSPRLLLKRISCWCRGICTWWGNQTWFNNGFGFENNWSHQIKVSTVPYGLPGKYQKTI